jgi:hypothetical protein
MAARAASYCTDRCEVPTSSAVNSPPSSNTAVAARKQHRRRRQKHQRGGRRQPGRAADRRYRNDEHIQHECKHRAIDGQHAIVQQLVAVHQGRNLRVNLLKALARKLVSRLPLAAYHAYQVKSFAAKNAQSIVHRRVTGQHAVEYQGVRGHHDHRHENQLNRLGDHFRIHLTLLCR